MVPALTGGGRSFKGAALYYLHDKRQQGEAARLTAGRVAWTETVNLMTDDPERAWRMMATTALVQAELKKAAGVKATGRKLEKPVFDYSLAWHPDEQPTRTDQLEAARASLKILGLEEHQALIVCHADEPHAHVHVIVNRVHPINGKAATLGNSKLALSKWAQDYEAARGRILCPARVENNARRQQGEKVQAPRVVRARHELLQTAASGTVSDTFARTDQAQLDAALAARGRAMHDAHRRQWEAMKRSYAEAKDGIYRDGATRRRLAVEAVKEAMRPEWRALFKRQQYESRLFDAHEHSLSGRFRNAAHAVRREGWKAGAGIVLAAMFNLAGGARRAAFDQRQQEERDSLARQARASTEGVTAALRRATQGELARLRDGYQQRCEDLRARQAEERDQLKASWKQRNADRRSALAPLQRQEPEQGRVPQRMASGRAGGRVEGGATVTAGLARRQL